MVKREGAGAFYRGLSWPLLSKSLEQALIFGLNSEARRRLPLSGEALVVASGALAGAATMGLLTPVYVVKVQLQIPPSERAQPFRGPLQCAAFNFRAYGVRGLYAGLLPSLLANPICFGVRFITYAKCQEAALKLITKAQADLDGDAASRHGDPSGGSRAARTTGDEEGERERGGQREGEERGGGRASQGAVMASQLLGGGVAGMVTWFSAYPLDVVMSKMQAQGAQRRFQGAAGAGAGGGGRKGMRWHIRDTYRAGGLRAFFKGLAPCLLRAFPVNAVIFLTFEQAAKLL